MTKREIAVLSFKVLGLYAFIRVIDHLPYILYMYTLQALWTQARERLDVVTVIFANRAYRILQGELRQMGIADPSPRAAAMLDLGDPDLDWVKLAEGMGVPGSRSRTAEEFAAQLQDAIRQAGPRLIEIVLYSQAGRARRLAAKVCNSFGDRLQQTAGPRRQPMEAGLILIRHD